MRCRGSRLRCRRTSRTRNASSVALVRATPPSTSRASPTGARAFFLSVSESGSSGGIALCQESSRRCRATAYRIAGISGESENASRACAARSAATESPSKARRASVGQSATVPEMHPAAPEASACGKYASDPAKTLSPGISAASARCSSRSFELSFKPAMTFGSSLLSRRTAAGVNVQPLIFGKL